MHSRDGCLLTVRVMVFLVHFVHTTEAAVSYPAYFRAETSANTAAAVAGFGAGVIFCAARFGVGRLRRICFALAVILAILVSTAGLKGETSVAAAVGICCTSACSSLALSLTLHRAGKGDGEKQDSEE
jgi:hypothetical protein